MYYIGLSHINYFISTIQKTGYCSSYFQHHQYFQTADIKFIHPYKSISYLLRVIYQELFTKNYLHFLILQSSHLKIFFGQAQVTVHISQFNINQAIFSIITFSWPSGSNEHQGRQEHIHKIKNRFQSNHQLQPLQPPSESTIRCLAGSSDREGLGFAWRPGNKILQQKIIVIKSNQKNNQTIGKQPKSNVINYTRTTVQQLPRKYYICLIANIIKQIMNQTQPPMSANKLQLEPSKITIQPALDDKARLTSAEDLSSLPFRKNQSLGKEEVKMDTGRELTKSNSKMIAEQQDASCRTRRGFRKNQQKPTQYKREKAYESSANTQSKHEIQSRQQSSKKQEDIQSDVYLKIVEYSKKIDWHKDTAIHKMNPFQYFTPSCFWFWVCAQYFSFNMGTKKNAHDASFEIIAKVNKIRYPIPNRFGKLLHFHQNEVDLLEMQTKNLKNICKPIVQILNDCIPPNSLLSHYDAVQKIPQITEVSDDNYFRSTTRVIVYNYVKKNCIGHIQNLLEQGVINLNKKSSNNLIRNMDCEVEAEKQNKKSVFEQETPKLLEKNHLEMQIEKPKQTPEEFIKQFDPTFMIQKDQRQFTEEDLLLDTILHLPLDIIIGILQAQIQEIRLPKISEDIIPTSSDPFELISPPHKQQAKFLEYLKIQKLRKTSLNENVQQPKINTLEENVAEDVKCQVCTDGDYTDDNLIVFCSTCNISVHQRCVGLAKVPAENWICDVCQAFGPKGRFLRCPLCTVRGGALKRTGISTDTMMFKDTNPSYHQFIKNCPHSKIKEQYPIQCKDQDSQNKLFYDYYDEMPSVIQEPPCTFVWIHYTCSIWVPECYFEERGGAINIKGVDNIDKKRFKLMCEVCHTAKSGAAIKCAQADCDCHYHAECARITGVYMEQRNVDNLKYYIYCRSHEPLKLTRIKQSKIKKSRDEIIKFCRGIEKYVDTYKIATVPFKLLKQNKKVKTNKKEHKGKQVKEHKQNDNIDFMQRLKDFLISGLKLVVSLKKVGENAFKVVDIEEPVKRALKSSINKNDEVWEYFTYKNLSSSQMYKKYKKVMKQMVDIKQKFCRDIKNQSKSSLKKKKRRTKEYEQAHAEEDPDQLYCVCRQKYVVGELMMQCDICEEWYHFKCIGFTGTEDDAGKVSYNCQQCEEFQDQAQIQERRQRFKEYYIPGFVVKYNIEKVSEDKHSQSSSQEVQLSELSNSDKGQDQGQNQDSEISYSNRNQQNGVEPFEVQQHKIISFQPQCQKGGQSHQQQAPRSLIAVATVEIERQSSGGIKKTDMDVEAQGVQK